MRCALSPHPAGPASPATAIAVDVERTGALLRLRYQASGDPGAIVWPPLRASEHADGLWKTTCFEAFLRRPGEAAYVELNFSPSTQWAAYRFDRTREGMRDLDGVAPTFGVSRSDLAQTRAHPNDRASTPLDRDGPSPARGPSDGFELAVQIDLASALDAHAPWRLALAAVIEDVRGAKTYWALAHPVAQPDFHHPDAFVLDLSPEQQA
ncbi:MAG: DOMON-like domain-containing protein [Hyphomonadaceae bacterium]|nr:DOMON-like domain-containing protein [Hyphomonadaceae bacterium]